MTVFDNNHHYWQYSEDIKKERNIYINWHLRNISSKVSYYGLQRLLNLRINCKRESFGQYTGNIKFNKKIMKGRCYKLEIAQKDLPEYEKFKTSFNYKSSGRAL